MTRQINEVIVASRLVVEELEAHLSGAYPGGFTSEKAADCRKRIMISMKTIERRIAQLNGLTNQAESEWLISKFDVWKRSLTSEPFPVLRLEDVQPTFAGAVANAQQAEDSFEKDLSEVRKRYLKT